MTLCAVFVALALASAACNPAPTEGISAVVTPQPPTEPSLTETSTPAAPDAAPTVDCTNVPGQVVQDSYRSLILGEDMPFRVYLPPCYGQSEKTFPAVYLLHGTPFVTGDWEILGVADLATQEIRTSAWPAFLIIMPQVPDKLYSETDGGPNSYEAEMVDGLVTYVDLNYRTDPRPDERALEGISRGGVWALEIGLRNPEVFSSVVAISPALAVNNPRPEYDPFVLAGRTTASPKNLALLTGDHDWAREATTQFDQVLTQHGIDHKFVIFQGSHEVATWKTNLQLILGTAIAAWTTQQ